MTSASDQTVRRIAEQTGDIIISVDRHGAVTYSSPAITRFGYAPEDIIGQKGLDLVHPLDRGKFAANTAALLRGELDPSADRQHRLRRADGGWAWIEGAPELLRDEAGEVIGFVNVLRDVTARREAEAALRESENRLRLITESSADIILQTDMEARLVFVSPAVRTLGFDPDSLIGTSFAALVHPDDLARAAENRERTLLGEPVLDASLRTNRYRTADGRWVWLEGNPRVLHDDSGQVIGTVNVLRDVTAQREDQAALRQSENRLRSITESSPDIILQTDLQGGVVFISPAVRAYGYEPEDIAALSLGALVHPDDVEYMLENRRLALNGEPLLDASKRAQRYQAADGSWVWLEGNPRVLHDEAGAVIGTVNVLRDVTKAREHSELFETAFEHAAIGKALVGLDGRFLRVNQAFGQMLGYSRAELLELDFQTLTHPEDLDADLELAVQLTAGEIDSYVMDKRYLRKDGEPVWVRLSGSMVRNADGSPKHYIAQIQDQTDQRRAEEALRDSEARHRVIADTTADLITMATMDGTLTFVSPSVRQLGYEPEALIGSKFTPNVHPDDIRGTWRGLKAMMEGGPSERQRWRARHGVTGEWRWMESSPSLTRDPETGAPIGIIDVVRDITRQVEQEEALKAAQTAAEAATAVKAQFVANMSHEIRNPLTAVLGFADVLGRSPTLAASDRRYVERIAGAGSALLAIVNDILDFSKLESGMVTITPGPTAITTVARESLALFESQAAGKGVDLVFETDGALPETVVLDGARVRQILINLIANAVKFTDAGKVTVRVLASRESEVRFEVADTGPGIAAADCARLFQRFSQIDGTVARRHGGTGLGLAICKGLADAMGGEIGVESEPGIGSTFHVALPFAQVEQGAADVPGLDASPMEGLRILVVEDNAANRELATLLLDALGVEVSTAETGAAALDRLAAQPFDAVLLDIRLPDLDGHEVLRRLRATPGPNQHAPTLAFTAEAQAEGGAIRQGFDGVVGKPIDTEAFLAALIEAVPWANA